MGRELDHSPVYSRDSLALNNEYVPVPFKHQHEVGHRALLLTEAPADAEEDVVEALVAENPDIFRSVN